MFTCEKCFQPISTLSKIFFAFLSLNFLASPLTTLQQLTQSPRHSEYMLHAKLSLQSFPYSNLDWLSLHRFLAADRLTTGLITEISGPTAQHLAKTRQISLINSTFHALCLSFRAQPANIGCLNICQIVCWGETDF